ncbi:MAG: PhzF family phenazine biosynthesis protein [Candidatus Eisenbacteria bacterium]
MKIYQADAFTDRPFGGNPAGVCLLDGPKEVPWMQSLAAEMNLSETAFLLPEGAGWNLRWFTPLTEVDLCGHATLASAHVLWEAGEVASGKPIEFTSRSGRLGARREGPRIVLDFPALPVEPATVSPEMTRALGIDPIYAGLTGKIHLLEVASAEIVRSMNPAFASLREFPGRGVMVTAAAGKQPFDFVSRYFAPWIGVDEDPVTGSAHCALGPYWSRRLGKTEMLAYQASRRGGVVHVRVDGSRVHLGGQAVTVLAGELRA